MGSLIQNTIFGRRKNKVFVSTWKTDNLSTGSSANNQIKLPLESYGSYAFTVYWGDGTSNFISSWNQTETTHTYSTIGTYQITILGKCKGWMFNNAGDRLKFLSVETWGILNLGNSGNYFYGCSNLNLAGVTDILNLTGTTSLSGCFANCTTLTTVGRINEWETSTIIDMSQLFSGATNFNQDISGWNVSAVTSMIGMFNRAANFNQNIGAWNVSACMSFGLMFGSAATFNNGGSPDINNWQIKTNGAINMSNMFHNVSGFNQPIGNWNVSAVTDMSGMFYTARSFNQNISSWNVSAVTNMSSMFGGATNFNQNIGSWDVSNVTNFGGMINSTAFNNGGSPDIKNWQIKTNSPVDMSNLFYGTPFNQNISSWNVSAVTNMLQMFAHSTFNQDIRNWNTGAVTNMVGMFSNNNIFNQPIGNWNTSKVTDMSNMFNSATAFNQDLGSWNISNVSNLGAFMGGKTPETFSASNLDAIYNGWSSRPVKPSIGLHFGSAKYTAASLAGRNILTGAPNTWTLSDGGMQQ